MPNNEDWIKQFDEEFLVKSKCCNSEVRKLQSRSDNHLYCKTCGRFCNEIEKTKAEELKSFILKWKSRWIEEVIEEINTCPFCNTETCSASPGYFNFWKEKHEKHCPPKEECGHLACGVFGECPHPCPITKPCWKHSKPTPNKDI
jgi:hypothetical protein